MSIQSQDVYANPTTLLTALSGSSVGDLPSQPNTFIVVTVEGGSDITRQLPLTGVFLQQDEQNAAASVPINFMASAASTIQEGVPQLYLNSSSDPTGNLYTSLIVRNYSETLQFANMAVNNLYLGDMANVPVTSDGININIPYSSIGGISSINGVNWAALVSTVNGLA